MKIVREGKEFELTQEELFAAYQEQKAIFDLSNIRDNMEGYLSPEEYARYKNNAEFIEAAAKRLRTNQDDYNMGYDAALTDAFEVTAKDFAVSVRQVHLTRENSEGEHIWGHVFWVDANKIPSKELFQEAVHAFLMTDEGRNVVAKLKNNFSWDDADIFIPEDFWCQFGIYAYDYCVAPDEVGLIPVPGVDPISIRVNDEESLIPANYFERSKAPKEPAPAQKASLADQIAGAAPRAGHSSGLGENRRQSGPIRL